MQALIDLAQKNPALVAFLWTAVLWPVVSAGGNKLLDYFVPRTEAAFFAYEQLHPRVAALTKIIRKLGFDPHALVARVRQVLNGKPPPLPASFGVVAAVGGNAGGDERLSATMTSSVVIPTKEAVALVSKGLAPMIVPARAGAVSRPDPSPKEKDPTDPNSQN